MVKNVNTVQTSYSQLCSLYHKHPNILDNLWGKAVIYVFVEIEKRSKYIIQAGPVVLSNNQIIAVYQQA